MEGEILHRTHLCFWAITMSSDNPFMEASVSRSWPWSNVLTQIFSLNFNFRTSVTFFRGLGTAQVANCRLSQAGPWLPSTILPVWSEPASEAGLTRRQLPGTSSSCHWHSGIRSTPTSEAGHWPAWQAPWAVRGWSRCLSLFIGSAYQ